MKIISLEFVNHIKLGTFKMNWNNSIISIVGANGSGKSFLLSSLHPYGTSDRYNKAYPVILNKTGYKKIVYDDNNIIYETIHEYTPYKSTHKCKSYLNKITNGEVEELNPTGNVETYKRLVFEHLKFNSDIFDVGFISFKANGITGTPTNRRHVLESTVDMKLLNKMKSNIVTLNSNQNAMVTISKKKQQELLTYGTVESIKESISNIKTDKTILEKNMENIDTSINAIRSSQMALFELDASSLSNIRLLVKNLSKTSLNAYNELLTAYNEAIYKIDGINNDLNKFNKIKEDIEYNNRLKSQKNLLEENINKKKSIQDELKNKLLSNIKSIDMFTINNVNKILSDIVKIANHVDKLSTPILNYKLEEVISNKNNEIKDMQSLINKYERALDLSDGKEYSVPYIDNCNSCELYKKFIKTGEYIKNNKRSYNSAIDNIKTIKYDVAILDNIKILANDVWNNDIISNNINENIVKYYGLDNINSFLSKNNSPDKINYLLNAINDNYNEYITGENDINDLNNKLIEANSKIKDIDYDLDRVNLELDRLIKNINKYKNILDIDINNIIIPDKYKFLTVNELIKVADEIENVDNKKKELEKDLNKALKERKEVETKISEYTKKIIMLEIKLSELENISKDLNKFLEEKEIISRCREIIEKNIPLLLLDNNLKFLEDMTNEILNENNIPISINIDIDNNIIIIPCTIDDTVVPDASMLSAGETCLVSLILNAAILHLLGYNILCLDEIDANLDVERRKQFNNIIVSIMTKLDIDQICCISHNISSTIDSTTIVQIGEAQYEVLSKDIIKL